MGLYSLFLKANSPPFCTFLFLAQGPPALSYVFSTPTSITAIFSQGTLVVSMENGISSRHTVSIGKGLMAGMTPVLLGTMRFALFTSIFVMKMVVVFLSQVFMV